MENKEIERIAYQLKYLNNPVYTNNDLIIQFIKKYNYYEINGDCSDVDLGGAYNPNYIYPSWYEYLNNNRDKEILFLIINIPENVSLNDQKRFRSIVKDRNYQTLNVPQNCKIVVFSNNRDKIDKELLSTLMVI